MNVEMLFVNSLSSSDLRDLHAIQPRPRFPPYVQRATALLSLLGIDEGRFSGEDAFQAALIDLCQRVREESAPPINTLDEFRRSFAARLRDCLVDERRRQVRRSEAGASS